MSCISFAISHLSHWTDCVDVHNFVARHQACIENKHDYFAKQGYSRGLLRYYQNNISLKCSLSTKDTTSQYLVYNQFFIIFLISTKRPINLKYNLIYAYVVHEHITFYFLNGHINISFSYTYCISYMKYMFRYSAHFILVVTTP